MVLTLLGSLQKTVHSHIALFDARLKLRVRTDSEVGSPVREEKSLAPLLDL